jgi:CRP/FNR family cyclic AMP-dependent transcriptional regulator
MSRKRDPRASILSTIDVLSGATARELHEICGLMTEVRLTAGRVLCRQGEQAREVFLLVDGQVGICRDDKVISLIGSGGIIGEMALLEQQPRTATATALTDVTALVMSTSEFWRLVGDHPVVAANLRALATRRTAEIDALVAA